MKFFETLGLCSLIAVSAALPAAADPFNLGAASGFAVLSGAQLLNSATVFNTNGLVGGVASTTGFSSSVVATSSAISAANTAFNSAYSSILSQTNAIPAIVALGSPLTPGNYQVTPGGGSYTLPSTLTFNGAGTYIIRINGSLTDNSTQFVLQNGATADDILFLATGANLEATSNAFAGTLFVGGSATVDAPGSIMGGLFAKGSIVIQDLHPGSGTETINTHSATTAAAVPEPTSVVLLLTLVGFAGFTTRRRLATHNPRG